MRRETQRDTSLCLSNWGVPHQTVRPFLDRKKARISGTPGFAE